MARDGSATSYARRKDNNQELDLGGKAAYGFATAPANPCRLYDMHGNVWEWVCDWYDRYSADMQGGFVGPPAPGADQGLRGPVGPAAPDGVHSHKLVRGGAFQRFSWALRSAYRYDVSPAAQFNFGFRIVCE